MSGACFPKQSVEIRHNNEMAICVTLAIVASPFTPNQRRVATWHILRSIYDRPIQAWLAQVLE